MQAAASIGENDFAEEAWEVANDIKALLEDYERDEIDIEEIQDLVEIELMSIVHRPDIAKAYILYRAERAQERAKLAKYQDIIRKRALVPDEANAKANANLDENSFSGRMYEASEDLWKEIALSEFMPTEIADLHRNMQLYLHDLSRFALGQHNCLTTDLEYILKHGLKTRQLQLRQPSRFYTACQQVAVIFQILSQCQFGGIASGHIDRDLAPYVAKSKQRLQKKYDYLKTKLNVQDMDYLIEKELNEELYQGCEALIHNLASLQSRPGSQLPFSSLNLGLDTSTEGRAVTKHLLEAMINGVGPHHTTPAFPILCFQIKKGINFYPTDPNYDLKLLAIKCAAMRLTPNFVNCDCSNDHGEPDNPDTWLTAMGCRTQNGFDRFNKEHPYNRIGRGNLAPHTIIPVSLGIKYGICQGKREKPDLEGFKKEFEYLLQKAEESLLIRVNLMFKQKMKNAYEMYVNHAWRADYEYDDNASVYEVLKHGTLAIGQLGWAETLIALFGKHHGESQEAADFLYEMVNRIFEFAKEASERNNLNFVAYHTPAENTCYTAMKKLKQVFGEMPGVTDHEYLTNSVHVPVWCDMDVFDKIELESKYAKLGSGGNIVYVEFDGTAIHNLKAVEQVIDFAMEHDVPYFGINFPLDECANCGYSGEIPYGGCPECGSGENKINRIRRVTGYINNDYRRSFNKGKQAEVEDRVTHTKGIQVKAE